MPKVIIDVREPDEYARGHAEGSINIPLAVIEKAELLKNTPKNSKVIVYCNSGNRSGIAKNVLEAKGFTNVTNGINLEKTRAII